MNNQYMQYPQMFPQPQGNVYTIQNSMEVANIPITNGCSVAICVPESLLFIKTIQNGNPCLSTYSIVPYETQNSQNFDEDRIKRLEDNVEKILAKFGGKDSVYI